MADDDVAGLQITVGHPPVMKSLDRLQCIAEGFGVCARCRTQRAQPQHSDGTTPTCSEGTTSRTLDDLNLIESEGTSL